MLGNPNGSFLDTTLSANIFGKHIANLILPKRINIINYDRVGRYGKIGTSAFVSSNSENISYTTFLKYKNSRKQELALWHLVNRLVQENA